MNKKSLLTMKDLTNAEIYDLLNDAKAFHSSHKDWQVPDKNHVLITNLFFEPSTRTHYSFLMSEHRLGVQSVDFNPESSSLTKGETLYDTVRTFEALGYGLLVIRHPQDDYFRQLESINVPIINAGDGAGHHPSQCLLDLLTIYEEFGRFKDLNVLICGDIAHSRVAASDGEALRRLGAHVRFAGPKEWERDGYAFFDFDENIEWADVIIMLRIQRERGAKLSSLGDDDYLDKYGLNKARYARMKEHAILMHPAPVNRGVEIDTDLVEAKKSRIFRQMENGVYVRMAMIKHALGYDPFGRSHV